MIRRLSIHQFVLFEQLEVELAPGLNVLSGGSGQGKTLVLEALRFALGEGGGRATAKRLVRRGAEGARVELELQPTARTLLKPVLGDRVAGRGPVMMVRTLSAKGRGRSTVAGQPLTLAELRAVGRTIGELYGQGAGPRLVESAQQREMLDAFAGTRDLAERYAAARDRSAALATEDEGLAQAELTARSEAAGARSERDALAELDPEPGEYETLNARLDDLSLRATRAERQVGAARRLCSDGGLQDGLLEVACSLANLAGSREGDDPAGSPDLRALSDQLEEAAGLVGDVGARLADAQEAVDRRELAALEGRAEAFRTLSRRLRVPPAALAERWLEVQARDPELLAERRAEVSRAFAAELRTLDGLGTELGAARRSAAARLGAAVTRTLRRRLGLREGSFIVELAPVCLERAVTEAVEASGLSARLAREHPSARGEDIRFRFTARREDEPATLDRASGGELARLFLAVGRHVAEHTGGGLLVFDEVDQNVGARLGGAVGDCLAVMALDRQILAVTHLAPVAARADRHLAVGKERHRTCVQALEGKAREEELALMIRGALTKTSLEQARELLAEVKPKRRRRRKKVSAA